MKPLGRWQLWDVVSMVFVAVAIVPWAWLPVPLAFAITAAFMIARALVGHFTYRAIRRGIRRQEDDRWWKIVNEIAGRRVAANGLRLVVAHRQSHEND